MLSGAFRSAFVLRASHGSKYARTRSYCTTKPGATNETAVKEEVEKEQTNAAVGKYLRKEMKNWNARLRKDEVKSVLEAYVTKQSVGTERVFALATARTYNLDMFSKWSEKYGLNTKPVVTNKAGLSAVMHLPIDHDTFSVRSGSIKGETPDWARLRSNTDRKDLFFFEEGVVVGWGIFSEAEVDDIQKLIKPAENFPAEVAFKDQLAYRLESSAANLDPRNDVISLQSNNDVSKKLVCSHALARSVKLEALVEDTNEVIRPFSSRTKKFRVTQSNPNLFLSDVFYASAKIYKLRDAIKIKLAMLDPPAYLWDEKELEELYNKLAHHLDVVDRTRHILEDIDIAEKNLKLLKEKYDEKHATNKVALLLGLAALCMFIYTIRQARFWDDVPYEDFWLWVIGRGDYPTQAKAKLEKTAEGDDE